MVSQKGTLILCYHRVAEGVEDPFGLCVKPRNFAAHLEEIARWREPSTLAELSVPSHRPRVVVTFDDGYRDNLTNALPIASAKGFPLTVFVVSGVLGDPNGYWWDRLGTLLRSRPPGTTEIRLPIREGVVRIALGSSSKDVELESVRQHLLPLPVAEIQRVIDDVSEQWSVDSAPPPDARSLTHSELIELASSKLVTIGAHTVDHVRLRGLPVQEQANTAATSKRELERLIGRSVSHFAYPFGGRDNIDEHSVDAARSAGFATACTTIPGTAGPTWDPYRLPRRVATDCGRLRFKAQMQRWKIG